MLKNLRRLLDSDNKYQQKQRLKSHPNDAAVAANIGAKPYLQTLSDTDCLRNEYRLSIYKCLFILTSIFDLRHLFKPKWLLASALLLTACSSPTTSSGNPVDCASLRMQCQFNGNVQPCLKIKQSPEAAERTRNLFAVYCAIES